MPSVVLCGGPGGGKTAVVEESLKNCPLLVATIACYGYRHDRVFLKELWESIRSAVSNYCNGFPKEISAMMLQKFASALSVQQASKFSTLCFNIKRLIDEVFWYDDGNRVITRMVIFLDRIDVIAELDCELALRLLDFTNVMYCHTYCCCYSLTVHTCKMVELL